jgi:spermidine synthase
MKSMPLFNQFALPAVTYLSVLTSGAVILVIEILGTRLLAPLYGTTIYVWSGLITVTLLGLACGYVAGGSLADKLRKPVWFFSIFILAGVSILLLLQFRGWILLTSEQAGVAYGPLAAALLLFLLPLAILGMVDPFAIKLQTHRLESVGRGAGFIFGLSTIGGLVGALLAAYILLPAFSLTQIFEGIGGVLIALGLVGVAGLWFTQSLDLPLTRNLLSGLFILVAGSFIVSQWGDNLSQQRIEAAGQRFGHAKILYQQQNLYSLNRVLGNPDEHGTLCFAADGGLQSCIDHNNPDEVGYVAKMGLFIKQVPKDGRMLLMGLGGGKIIKEQSRDDIDTDVVEINPASVTAATKYMGVTWNDRETIHLMDARRYLRTTDYHYNLILIDVSTTLTPPAHLYTKEFFDLVANRLTDTGVAVFQITEENTKGDVGYNSLLTTIQSVFPNLYADHDGAVILLVMAKRPVPDLITHVNAGVRQIQSDYNAAYAVHEFAPTQPDPATKAVMFTDDHNLVDYYWRSKIPLFKRFNTLLKEDVM